MRKVTLSITALTITICLGMCANLPAQDDHPPATQPTTSKSDASIQKQFNLLFDADPKVRDRARTDLMGAEVKDLDVLKQLVKEKSPLPPEVLEAVHDVVIQVFLAHEKYTDLNQQDVDASGRTGPFFLGVTWHGSPDTGRLGLTVEERMPGFPSYRFLRRGDLILDVTLHTGEPPTPTHNVNELKTAIAFAPGVQDIVLSVVRNGEEITIPITMAPRPLQSGPPDNAQQPQLPVINYVDAIEMFVSVRTRSAEDYWHANFESDKSVRVGE